MPVTKVQAPDGSTISVEHPEGASQDDILSFAQANYKPKAQDVEQVDVEELYRQAGGVEREPYITEVPFPEQAERKKKLYDEDLSFVQNVDRLAFDIGNQFNNSLANMAGAPLNLIGAGMAKIRSKITGDEYVSPDYKEGLRKTMDLLPSVTVLDEEPRTPLGYVVRLEPKPLHSLFHK